MESKSMKWYGWVSCSLWLLGVSSALFISAPQRSIVGAVNQSVLLPVSYRMNGSLNVPLLIAWKRNDISNAIIAYKLNNISLGEDGSPLKCDGSLFTHDTYLDRVIFYPENASLRLLSLQVNDGGVYTVSFRDARQSRDITLSVSSAQEPPGNGTSEGASGVSSALFISAPQRSIVGAVNQSVLLPVSYRMNGSLNVPLLIAWKRNDISNAIIAYKLNNISLGEDGSPLKCDGSLFTHDTYLDRVIFYPENASLRLLSLQVNDGGVYTVSFRDARQSRDITLSVSSAQEPPGNGTSEGASEEDVAGDAVGGISVIFIFWVSCGFIILLALFFFLFESWTARKQQHTGEGF